MKQRYIKRSCTDEQSKQYLIDKGFTQQIAEALSARGVNRDNFAEIFGNANVFHSPSEMLNMDDAAETVRYVMDSGGSILIYGDYDADGLTAASILSLYFTDNGVDNDVIIPTRDEGYGLHADSVLAAFGKKCYDLVITVDCGISNADEVARIVEETDVEVIVTDHHELPERLPDCLCVNPKMGYPFPFLSGAGVAWKLVEALSDRHTAAKYSCLACVGTIADIMPLQDENRSIVRLGLANWNHKGLKRLAEAANCPNLTAADISLRIAPKINAAGRVGSPQTALNLLLARDAVRADVITGLLALNDKRKQLLDETVKQAEGMCDSRVVHRERMVFLYSDNWQHGLLGIAAARFKEKYNVPAIIMTADGDNYVGSARGTDAMDLFELFSACKQHLVKFGGHKASVGFSVAKDKVNLLRAALADELAAMDASCFERVMYYDVELGGDCTAEQVYALSERMQPLLPGDKLICRVKDFVKYANSFGKDDAHLSATLGCGLEVKGFFGSGIYSQYIRNGANVDLLCSIEKDSFSGNVYGSICDISLLNSVCFDEFYKLNLMRGFVTDSFDCHADSEIDALLRERSVVAVFDDYATFLSYADKYNFDDYSVDIFFDKSVSEHTVAISPAANYCFDRFERVLCFARRGIHRVFPAGSVVFNVIPASAELYSLEMSRDICRKAFAALKMKNRFETLRAAYDKYLLSTMSYSQFVVAIRVFEQLNIIKIIDSYTVEFCATAKRDLTDSSIYRCFVG